MAYMVDLFQSDDLGFPKNLESVDFGISLMVEGYMCSCNGTNETDSCESSFLKKKPLDVMF